MRCKALDRMVKFFSCWKDVRGRDYILDAAFYITLILFALIYIQKNIQGMPDDAYITYRYAYNLITGHGLVFNVDERYYGSTAMGFALFLGSITLVVQGIQKFLGVQAPVNIPEVAVAVSAFSLLLIGACWYKILKRCSRPILAWFGSMVIGVYFIVSWYSGRAIGMETYAYSALLFLSSYLFIFAKRPIISGIVLAVAVTTRPDTILFATILFFVSIIDYYTFNKGDKRYLKHIIMGVISFAPIIFLWEICLYYYFGSWIPGTMRAKKAQVFLGHWEIFNVENILSALNKGAFPGFLLLLIFVMAAVVILFTRQAITRNNASLSDVSKGLLKLYIMWVLFGTGVIVAYTSFRITAWPWYEVPIYFSLLNALISGIILLLKPFRGKIALWKWQVKVFSIIAVSLITVPITLKTYKYLEYWRNTNNNNLHISSYDPIVNYLKRNEPNGTTIATAEPGAFGYKLGPNYKVIDYLGLISPGVADSIITRDNDYYFEKWRPEYIIVSWEGHYTPTGLQWFKENYELYGEFNHPHWQYFLKRGAYLFKYKAPAGE